MILTDDQIIEKYAIICPHVIEKLCYLMLMNGLV